MTRSGILDGFRTPEVSFPAGGHRVEGAAAEAVARRLGLGAAVPRSAPGPGLRVAVAGGAWDLGPAAAATEEGPWMWVRLAPAGDGELVASEPALLLGLAGLLGDGLLDELQPRGRVEDGLLLAASFAWNRPVFDLVMTQTARGARGFDPDAYARRLAESGFTHFEVNALAGEGSPEPGVPGEFYSEFYGYGAALCMFVETELTRGLYPPGRIERNLGRLKELAAAGRRHGLRPGLLCYEPRSLPEEVFRRHPTLRGARVDHPFRSHRPRYTLAQDHPATRAHYRELIRSLLREVPDLAYLSVWTNDSGAGFEHSASLYAGRNGGPFLVREWGGAEQIARAAGESAVRFLRLLRDAAAELCPDFVVSLRIEPFEVEHDRIVAGLGDGLTLEAPSLLARGYDLPYPHPLYADQRGVAGTLHHVALDPAEGERLAVLRARGVEPILGYAASSAFNLEPLLGIPFPRALHEKLMGLRRLGFRRVSALGGLVWSDRCPYWPNPEALRCAQLVPELPLDAVLRRAAARWAGRSRAAALVELWDRVEDAVRRLPVIPLYGSFGFVWMRTWVRPLVPDIEAIPEADRRYYERFMVSTANNPGRNDLGRDVLFELITRETGRRIADRIDAAVLPRLAALLDDLRAAGHPVLIDLRDRVRALRCWATTQRNTCAWVAGVHGFLASDRAEERAAHRAYVAAMVASELANTRDLLDLWNGSETEWMLVAPDRESCFLYGAADFAAHLGRKIDLMERYGDREPRIDRDILWRL